ncbi:MAG: hypothetical protein RIS47_630 [Bacteroidota bacterium]
MKIRIFNSHPTTLPLNSFIIFTVGIIFFMCSSCTQHGKHPSKASGIHYFPKFKSAFVEPRNVEVWLPSGYSRTDSTRYAVIYMQDGQNLFDDNDAIGKVEWGVDEALTRLANEGKIRPCIVVGIWNTRFRYCEYLPQQAFKTFDTLAQHEIVETYGKLQSDNYLRFIVEELKPFIDTTFRTRPDRDNTFVIGSSMGGLISAYALARYPDVFGGAACLSTHWPVTRYLRNDSLTPIRLVHYFGQYLPPASDHRLYFDYGTLSLDSTYEYYQMLLDRDLTTLGYTPGYDWLTLKFDGHDHIESFWRQRLDIPLEFLLRDVPELRAQDTPPRTKPQPWRRPL